LEKQTLTVKIKESLTADKALGRAKKIAAESEVIRASLTLERKLVIEIINMLMGFKGVLPSGCDVYFGEQPDAASKVGKAFTWKKAGSFINLVVARELADRRKEYKELSNKLIDILTKVLSGKMKAEDVNTESLPGHLHRIRKLNNSSVGPRHMKEAFKKVSKLHKNIKKEANKSAR
jgi:hypothetical protein